MTPTAQACARFWWAFRVGGAGHWGDPLTGFYYWNTRAWLFKLPAPRRSPASR